MVTALWYPWIQNVRSEWIMDLDSFEGPERVELAPGYSVSRVINGCWQLSEGHSLTSPIDFDDVTRAFFELTELGFTTFDCGDIYTGVEEFLGTFVE